MHRSGFASLIALVALALAGTLVAGMLAAARSATMQSLVADQRLAQEDLLADGERLACGWLERHAAGVVLPPSGGGVLLLDARWTDAGGRQARLAIVAHDALATLPRAALVAGHPLRLALASPGSSPVLRGDPLAVHPADLAAAVALPAGWSRLPSRIPADQPVGACIDPQLLGDGPSLVCWFNPDNPGAINLNTAPAAIVRAVCAGAGNGPDAEAIVALRRAGTRWEAAGGVGADGVHLSTTSSRWGLLIVAELAGRTVARWAVADGATGQYTIIRRHDATPPPPSAPAP